jgi:predicted amidophosphoribosyltransferase
MQSLEWTRLLTALNQERQWPLKRLFALLDPLLEPGIALAVVPPHRAYQAFWPTRTLARQLAGEQGRIDATACLVRHTSIRRITFGGPSTRALHRQTIRVEKAELVAGQRVLLLDDIARSGASLRTCQELLYEAGAAFVQAVALGQVVLSNR